MGVGEGGPWGADPHFPPQNSAQFLKHTRRRRLTVEDFNRALRWSNVEVGAH